MEDTKTKALRVIETLVLLQVHSTFGTEEQKKSRLEEFLSDIYKFSHIALDECENEHEDWRDELDCVYNALRDDGHIN